MKGIKITTILATFVAAAAVMALVFTGGVQVMSKLRAEESFTVPASRIKDAMVKMHCEAYAELPLNDNIIYRCDNKEIICYIMAPGAQMHCRFL